MRIIYLCGLFPKKLENEIELNSKGLIQYGPNKLQYTFLDGLGLYCDDVTVITAPLLGTYPNSYKKTFIKSNRFKVFGKDNGFSVFVLTLPFISMFSKMVSLFFRLINVIKKNEKNLIFIYSPHLPYILSALFCKIFYSDLKICVYINDLPEYMSAKKNIMYLIAKKIEKYFFNNSLKFVDLFLVVTDKIPERLNIANKPFFCLEGVYKENITQSTNIVNITSSKNKIILYTGTLDKRYGIDHLLNAFSILKEDFYELWICGFGDMESEIIKHLKIDPRIKFLGQRTHLEVLQLQKRANLLVNPRLPIGDYTKYSFPIKTLEFLASGKPCIMYKLDGIPEMYHNYFYTPNNLSLESLAEKMLEVLNTDNKILESNGLKSRNFILNEIGPEKKFKEIYNFFLKNV